MTDPDVSLLPAQTPCAYGSETSVGAGALENVAGRDLQKRSKRPGAQRLRWCRQPPNDMDSQTSGPSQSWAAQPQESGAAKMLLIVATIGANARTCALISRSCSRFGDPTARVRTEQQHRTTAHLPAGRVPIWHLGLRNYRSVRDREQLGGRGRSTHTPAGIIGSRIGLDGGRRRSQVALAAVLRMRSRPPVPFG